MSRVSMIAARLRRSTVALTCLFLAGAGGATAASIRFEPRATGGVGFGGPAPTTSHLRVPSPPGRNSHGRWLTGFATTEYWPAPESWFIGRLVSVPGLSGRHRIDWLYSAMGVSMEGEGIGLDGRLYHIDSLGLGGWVTKSGASTDAGRGWSAGPPYWRAGGYWRNSHGGVTFPLSAGGWESGTGRRYIPLRDVSFAAGPSLPLKFWQSIAVDPSVIPLGSRVYIPAYRRDGYGGWFVAQDTGGAINGRHVDVYRRPPAHASDTGQYLTGQRVYVIKPR